MSWLTGANSSSETAHVGLGRVRGGHGAKSTARCHDCGISAPPCRGNRRYRRVPSVLVSSPPWARSSGRTASTGRASRRCSARAAWSPRPGGTRCGRWGTGGARCGSPYAGRTPDRGRRAGGAGAGLPGRRRHAAADGRRAAPRRASAPTAPTSTPTSAARSTPPPSSRRGWSRSRSGAAAGSGSSGTAWAGCWRAASPYAVPTWCPGSSPWAARCSRPGAHHRTLTASVDVLVRLSRAGVPGLMSEDCVARRLRPAELRREPAAGAAGRRRSPRSGPGATASSTGGRASTRWREPIEVTRPHTSGWPSTRGSSTTWSATLRAQRRQFSKSIAAKVRSFCSLCSEVIERIVPLRERITSECVVQPPAR